MLGREQEKSFQLVLAFNIRELIASLIIWAFLVVRRV